MNPADIQQLGSLGLLAIGIGILWKRYVSEQERHAKAYEDMVQRHASLVEAVTKVATLMSETARVLAQELHELEKSSSKRDS